MSVATISYDYEVAGTETALNVDSVTLGPVAYDERYAINVANGKPIGVGHITTAQRNALTPTNGMIVYDTDVQNLFTYVNGAWVATGGMGLVGLTSTGATLTITNPGGPTANLEVSDPLTIGEVTFLAAGGGGAYGHTSITAPAAAYLDYTITLPNVECPTNGYALTSDTTGQLSWSAVGVGSVDDIVSGGTIVVTNPHGPTTTVDVNPDLTIDSLIASTNIGTPSLNIANVTNTTTLTTAATSTYTLVFPTGLPGGAGAVLGSDTGGNLSWATAAPVTTSVSMTFACTAWSAGSIASNVRWAKSGDYVFLSFPAFVDSSTAATPGMMTSSLPGGVPVPTVNAYLPVVVTDCVDGVGTSPHGPWGMLTILTTGDVTVASFANKDYTGGNFNTFSATSANPIGLDGQTIVYYVGS